MIETRCSYRRLVAYTANAPVSNQPPAVHALRVWSRTPEWRHGASPGPGAVQGYTTEPTLGWYARRSLPAPSRLHFPTAPSPSCCTNLCPKRGRGRGGEGVAGQAVAELAEQGGRERGAEAAHMGPSYETPRLFSSLALAAGRLRLSPSRMTRLPAPAAVAPIAGSLTDADTRRPHSTGVAHPEGRALV